MIIDLYDNDNRRIAENVTLARALTDLQDKDTPCHFAYIYVWDGGPVDTVLMAEYPNGGSDLQVKAHHIPNTRPRPEALTPPERHNS